MPSGLNFPAELVNYIFVANVSIQIYASARTQLYPAITNGVLFDLFHTHKKMIVGLIHTSASQEGHEHTIWVEFSS